MENIGLTKSYYYYYFVFPNAFYLKFFITRQPNTAGNSHKLGQSGRGKQEENES